MTNLLNQTFHPALTQRASDIHFEPEGNHYRIKLRMDGVLHALPEVAIKMGTTITIRLKVLDGLDIAEHRLPQDGQFTIEISGEPVSSRIATLPCHYGEKVVLRLLHQVDQSLGIAALGMQDVQLAVLSQVSQQPQGLILVTGPTGSNKTVTLYSALQTRDIPDVSPCDVGDPIEIPIAGLNQMQIHPCAGLTFQGILRALLRQDPDIIMMDEVRDGETAEIALKAAQTDHLALSTLHANSTGEMLVRLQQMGIAHWMIASALALVIAQRLARKLCPHCRQRQSAPIKPPKIIWSTPLPNWQASGYKHCYHGFCGRTALFEVLPTTPTLRQSIVNDTSADGMESDVRQSGMRTFFKNGCQAVEQGLATFEELIHVLGVPHVR